MSYVFKYILHFGNTELFIIIHDISPGFQICESKHLVDLFIG